MLLLAVISFGAAASNLWAITQTLAGPQAAGRWTGFQNFVGNLGGVVAPAITGSVRGFRHTHGRRTDRNNVLGFPGRTGRASDLAQDAPSCHSLPIARIFSSYLEYAPFLAEVTCRSEI